MTDPIKIVRITQQGPAGPQGSTGSAGKSVLNGAGAPGAGTGQDGEFYIDTVANAIYGPKTAGVWGPATSLSGVRYDAAQNLSAGEQQQARTNISAQASSAVLSALAALALSAGSVVYATGATTFDVAPSTAYGRGVLNAADAAAGRTYFGLGSAAVLDAAVANGTATLDATGKVPLAQIPQSLIGAANYQSAWNASTNSPAIPAAASGNKGWYYVVSVPGATLIDGISDWKLGDWIISNGTAWEKVDNTDAVISVAGLTGSITAAALKTALAIAVGDVSGLGALATLGVGSGLTSAGGNLSAAVLSVAGRTGAVTLAQADIAGLTTASTPTFSGVISAGVVAVRDGVNPQALRVYNTYTNASNFEASQMGWGGSEVFIGTYAAGAGTVRNARFVAGSSGILVYGNGTSGFDFYQANSEFFAALGPRSASYPALKRSSTTLQVRLANDSDFAPLSAAVVEVAKAYTVATLPTAVIGKMARVTDGDASLAWGATVINSGAGATSYLVWYNGTSWTVVGK